MADTSGIDKFFDAFDGFVDTADRVLNGKKAEEASAKSRSATKATPALKSTAITSRKARFRIDEVTDANTGEVLYIVTDGATARCEFSSHKIAMQILAMLEAG